MSQHNTKIASVTAMEEPQAVAVLREPKQYLALQSFLAKVPQRVIACSGGIDSMLLATLAHRQSPAATMVAHAVSPAVPSEASQRVSDWAEQEGWNLLVVESGEFQDEDYLNNPVNRCYYCKTNLYRALHEISDGVAPDQTIMSGANMDDLGEYRPGLIAATENAVRHPYIERGVDKAGIREVARYLNLPFADIPASPCLASRLYTGTTVTAARLGAVESGEASIRALTGISVVRCRVRGEQMCVEVSDADREMITPDLLAKLLSVVRGHKAGLQQVSLDPKPYRPGRAFIASA
jgi:uncharacterized protein